MTPEELNKARLAALYEAEEDDELLMVKEHICSFYRPSSPGCVGCRQPDDKLEACRDDYTGKIGKFMYLEFWEPLFDLPVIKVREKKKIAEITEIGITCDHCYMSEKCPMYEANATCGIDWGTEEEITPTAAFDFLLKLQHERVTRASVFEKVDGGMPDANLSTEMDRLATLLERKDNMGAPRLKMTLEGSGESGVKAGGGLLASLFAGALGGPKTEEAKPLEIEPATTEYIDVTALPEPEFVEEKEKKRKPTSEKRKVE